VANYGASNAGEVTPANVTGRGRERGSDDGDDRWGRLVGEREREMRGWAGSGQAGPAGSRGRPSWASCLFLLFFSSASLFSFILISVLSFERVLLFRFGRK
jgi:hypothetical protein